jgi:signal peptidase II
MFLLWFIDGAVKYWTVHHFSDVLTHEKIVVFREWLGVDFLITYATNKGAAWNVLEQNPDFLLGLRLILVCVLVLYLFLASLSFGSRCALALIIGGALGNISDRYFYGHVIDMFQLNFGSYSFPVFNVADSGISVGALGLILLKFTEKK